MIILFLKRNHFNIIYGNKNKDYKKRIYLLLALLLSTPEKIVAEVWPPQKSHFQQPTSRTETSIHLDIINIEGPDRTCEYQIPEDDNLKGEVLKRIAIAAGKNFARQLNAEFQGFWKYKQGSWQGYTSEPRKRDFSIS